MGAAKHPWCLGGTSQSLTQFSGEKAASSVAALTSSSITSTLHPFTHPSCKFQVHSHLIFPLGSPTHWSDLSFFPGSLAWNSIQTFSLVFVQSLTFLFPKHVIMLAFFFIHLLIGGHIQLYSRLFLFLCSSNPWLWSGNHVVLRTKLSLVTCQKRPYLLSHTISPAPY